MDNIIHLNLSDPIIDEFEAFVDKTAGIKTIAFKYFGADTDKAAEYLNIERLGSLKSIDKIDQFQVGNFQEFYQPELSF
jgi:hypothetical protein